VNELTPVTTSVRHVDRGAWLSVDGTKEIGISDLWQFVDPEFCGCDVTDFLAQGIVELGIEGTTIEARLAGQCIQCGVDGTTGWVKLGRIVTTDDQQFYPMDPAAVQFATR